MNISPSTPLYNYALKSIFLFILFFLSLSHINAQSYRWAVRSTSATDDNARHIAVDNMGNYYVIGQFSGTINFDSAGFTRTLVSAGQMDVYIAKFNCSRNLIWANRIGGASSEGGNFNYFTIEYDRIGNVYATGTFAGSATFTNKGGSSQILNSYGDNDIFLAKYDTSGVLKWALKAGSTDTDEGTRVLVDHSGNIIVAGYFKGTATWGATSGPTISLSSGGVSDMFIGKYNPSGQPIWIKTASSPGEDIINYLAVDRQNNIYAASNFAYNGGTATYGTKTISNLSGGWGAGLSKMDSNGVWSWVRGMGGSASEAGASCIVDDSGSVFFSGHYDGATTLSSSSPGAPIPLPNNGNYDIFLAKYDTAGVLYWAKAIGGSGLDLNHAICFNRRNNVVIIGGFSGTTNFSGINLTSAGSLDVYVAEYSKSGNIVQAIKGGGSGYDDGNSITEDSKGGIYFTGLFYNTASFGPFSLSGLGASESFVAKLSLGNSFELNSPSLSCSTGNVTLRSLQPLPSNSTFKWLKNGGIISGETKDSLIVSSVDTYQLIATNSCNESDTSVAKVVNITSLNAAPISDKIICSGDSVQLNVTGGTTHSWSPATGLSNPNIANPYAKPSSTQQYIVTITTGGCSVNDTVLVTVNTDCCFNCTLPASSINTGLVACYPFNGNANDESNNGNNGTAQANAILTTNRKNQASKAYVFNATATSRINIPASPSLNTATMSGFTYACWFNASSSNSIRRLVSIQDGSLKNYDLGYNFTNNKLNFINYNGVSDNINFDSKTTFVLGTWYHVALVIDATNKPQLYVNGVLDTFSTTTVLKPVNPTYTIGNHTVNPWNFSGKIDDIRVYNRALSAAELMQLITQIDPLSAAPITDKIICMGDSVQLTATGGTSYSWSPATGLSNPNIANPFAKPTATQQYIVTISNGICTVTDTVIVNVNTNCCFSCTTSLPINSGLVACYTFNGNANDESNNGNNGTAQANAILTTNRKNQASKAYAFDGTANSRINVPASASLNTATMSGFTYACWFNASSSNSNRRLFSIQDPSLINYDISYVYAANKIDFINFNGVADHINLMSKTTFALGTWYHLALVIDATNKPQLYVNGILDTFSTTTVLKPANPTYTIGNHTTNPWNFSGKLDDIRVYNRALSATELTQLYSQLDPLSTGPLSDKTICLGDSVQLTATGGTTYLWNASPSLSNTAIANPYAKPIDTTKYYVTVSTNICSAFDSVRVNVNKITVDAGADQTICFRDSIQLHATKIAGATYAWTPAISLNSATIDSPYAKPADTTLYRVTATLNGCSAKDSVTINVRKIPADAGANQNICMGDSIQLNASGGTSYAWNQNSTLSDTAIRNPYAKPGITTKYFVTVKDGSCSLTDSVTISIATSLNLNAGVDTSICLGDSVRLLVTGATSYTWSTAATLSDSTVANPFAKPSDTTMYYVTGKSAACIAVDSVKVNVKKPALDAGLTRTICKGDSIQLNATGTLGSIFTWISNTSLSNPSISNPYAKPSDTTKYYVSGLSNGCILQDSIIINVRSVAADAGAGGAICMGDSIRLNAAGGIAYTWKNDPSLSSVVVMNPYAKPFTTTTYYVTVNDGTCNNTDSVEVTVNNTINLNAGSDTFICSGDSIQLSATGTALSYTWTPASGLSNTTIANPKASPLNSTDYIVMGQSGVCYDLDTIKVTVNPGATVNLGPDTAKCKDQPFSFTPSVTNADVYSWQPSSEVSDPTILDPLINTNTAQTFILTVTNSTSGCKSSDTIIVNVQKPIAEFSLDETKSNLPPFIVTPNNTSRPLPLTYDWEMMDTVAAFYTSMEPTHTFTKPGFYTILLTVTDDMGCIDTVSHMIELTQEAPIFIPNVFTPNGDGLNDVFEVRFTPGTILGMKGTIWNRWGAKIYEFGSPDYTWWNGKSEEQDASAGVYFYIVEVIDLQNQVLRFNGTVTLLR